MVSFQTVKPDLTQRKSGTNMPPSVVLFAWAGTQQWLRSPWAHAPGSLWSLSLLGGGQIASFSQVFVICQLKSWVTISMQVKAQALCQGTKSELNIWVSDSVPGEEAGLEAVHPDASRLGKAGMCTAQRRAQDWSFYGQKSESRPWSLLDKYLPAAYGQEPYFTVTRRKGEDYPTDVPGLHRHAGVI